MDRGLSPALVAILEWIRTKREEPIEILVTPDTDLIENRLIDSLDFVEFLFFLEELTGTPIDLDDVDLDSFRTMRTIEARFLSGGQMHVHD